MKDIVNAEQERWIRPWNIKKFDNLFERDDRFFAILIKGAISWLNRNIVLYDEGINHYIFNTGSSVLYVESNGYEYSLTETTGEDWMYNKMPRCIIELDNISIPTDDLSASFSTGVYERRTKNSIKGYNAIIKRMPIEMHLNLHYVLSNMNEVLILVEELIDKLVYQTYFNITYLGNTIQCSIEFPADYNIQINKIDMTSTDVNQKTIDISLNIRTNYPKINEDSEVSNSDVIDSFDYNIHTDSGNPDQIHI